MRTEYASNATTSFRRWCKDCDIGVSMCRGCIRSSHKVNLLHQIERWNRSFFRPAELWEVSTHLLVPHHQGAAF